MSFVLFVWELAIVWALSARDWIVEHEDVLFRCGLVVAAVVVFVAAFWLAGLSDAAENMR